MTAPDPKALWLKAQKLRASKKYSLAQVDQALQEKLGVDFQTLTQQLYGKSGAPFVGTETLADPDYQAAQKGVGPVETAMLTPLLGASLGWAEKLSPTLRAYGEMANKAAPLNAAMGRLTGGIIPAALAGKIPVPGGESALAPLHGAITGAVQGAPLGLLAGLAQEPDVAHPDLGRVASATAATAAAGGVGGLLGEMGSTIYNPAAQRLKTQTETSAPGMQFNLRRGLAALEDQPTAAPVLDRLMAERGNLGTLGTKYVRQSQVAADDAAKLIAQRLEAVTTAKNVIANHPATGYDAILGAPIRTERAVTIWRQKGHTGEPTGRELFSLYKRLRDQVQQKQAVIARGTGTVDKEAMHQANTTATELRDILGQEVPGFNELQAQTQPYLDREQALRTLMVRLRGRGVYLKGKMPPPPPKGVTEKMREALKLTNYFGGERAARSMVTPLYGTTAPADMLAQIKALEATQTMGRALPIFGSGATAGLLGLPHVRDRLGLLGP